MKGAVSAKPFKGPIQGRNGGEKCFLDEGEGEGAIDLKFNYANISIIQP